ncbi:hypothetical protein ATANTOWER_018365 [Ataeniobius toweri]|uniref:Immunoglobulin V-set domain-containing protein n=1 Tax=Ataeniobius toweri TaxID=208326 RepID=A0ABU7BJC2_9TELE|nr:hypothetical protein [Ataeniobius toweri]
MSKTFAFSAAPRDRKVVKVGETVTLDPNKTQEPLKNFLWSFGQQAPVETITIVTNRELTQVNGTRFGNRLHTNALSGLITISNLRVSDSGTFCIQIFTESHILTESIILTIEDNLKNVLEGENVTLETPMDQLETKHTVTWTKRNGDEWKLIAQWKHSGTIIEESFKDVLQLNPQTGYLTFIRVR